MGGFISTHFGGEPEETCDPARQVSRATYSGASSMDELRRLKDPMKMEMESVTSTISLATSSRDETSSAGTKGMASNTSNAGTTQDGVELPSDGFPSVGSVHHEEGACRPCFYVFSDIGCGSGQACDFCRIPHARKNRGRPCKAKRLRFQKVIAQMTAESLRLLGDPLGEPEKAEVCNGKTRRRASDRARKNTSNLVVDCGTVKAGFVSSSASSSQSCSLAAGPHPVPASSNRPCWSASLGDERSNIAL